MCAHSELNPPLSGGGQLIVTTTSVANVGAQRMWAKRVVSPATSPNMVLVALESRRNLITSGGAYHRHTRVHDPCKPIAARQSLKRPLGVAVSLRGMASSWLDVNMLQK